MYLVFYKEDVVAVFLTKEGAIHWASNNPADNHTIELWEGDYCLARMKKIGDVWAYFKEE